MNRLEFNEVLKAVGINNPLSTTMSKYGTIEEVHFWENMAINFSGNYYTIIHGRIPLEVANIIYEKYPNNPYKIRVDGGNCDIAPNKYAIDEQFKKEIKEYLELYRDINEYSEYRIKYEESRKNMLNRKNETKYIEWYHIDTKEGLVIFFTEMKDYLARKNGTIETEVQRFDELMTTITTEILKKVNLNISTYEWMQADSENYETFFSTVLKNNHTIFGRLFRKALDDFDKTVNPYINEEIELDDINNYLKKINIDANTYDFKDGKYRKKLCHMYITDIATKNKVSYYRRPDGFSYQVEYKIGENAKFNLVHSFSSTGDTEKEKGETIYINYFGKNIKEKIEFIYNITHEMSGESYKEKVPATIQQMAFVYDELLKAIEYASTITIDNMKKTNYTKKVFTNNK